MSPMLWRPTQAIQNLRPKCPKVTESNPKNTNKKEPARFSVITDGWFPCFASTSRSVSPRAPQRWSAPNHFWLCSSWLELIFAQINFLKCYYASICLSSEINEWNPYVKKQILANIFEANLLVANIIQKRAYFPESSYKSGQTGRPRAQIVKSNKNWDASSLNANDY